MFFHAPIVGLFLQTNVRVQMLDTAAKDGEKSVCKGWEEGVVEAMKTVEEYGLPMSDAQRRSLYENRTLNLMFDFHTLFSCC